jgi:hypothetical protein
VSATAARTIDNVLEAFHDTRGRRTDPPPSSWPHSMRSLYEAGLEFAAGVHAYAEGSSRAPFCHVWRLYESWVAARILLIATDYIGPPDIPPRVVSTNSRGEPVWCAGWCQGNTRIWLWSQPEITGAAENVGLPITSCTSALLPDCLVSAEEGGRFAAIAFEAKYRGDVRMTSGDLGAAGAKYMWGIRTSSGVSQPALRRVVVVSSGGSGTVYKAAVARTTGIAAHPADNDALESAVRTALAEVFSAVRPT